MTIEFTPEEAQNLVNLLDAAVRSQGMQAAVVALPLFQKIKEAAERKEPQE